MASEDEASASSEQRSDDSMTSESDDSESSGSQDSGSPTGGDPPSDHELDRLQAAEDAVRRQPSSYEAHIKLITLLSELRLKQRLRAAREDLARRFPLSEDLWMAWIADELEEVHGGQSSSQFLDLLKRAVSDYLSVDLWQHYLAVVESLHDGSSDAGVEAVRATAADARRACGLHVARGDVVHQQICSFECNQVSAALQAGEDPTDALAQARSAWHNRLGCILQTQRGTMEAYVAWEDSLPADLQQPVPEHVRKAHHRALAGLQVRKTFEADIADTRNGDAALAAAFKRYISFEETQGGPGAQARLVLLHERAVASMPLDSGFWQGLLDAVHVAEGPPAALAVSRRACRNCPWHGAFWAARLRGMEVGHGAPDGAPAGGEGLLDSTWWSDFESVYNEALQVGLQAANDYAEVITTALNAVRRGHGSCWDPKHTDLAIKATALVAAYFPEDLSTRLQITDRAADVLGTCCHSEGVAKGREIWHKLLSWRTTARHATALQQYAHWELRQGSWARARAKYREVLASGNKLKLGDVRQLEIATELVDFECRYGGADDERSARKQLLVLQQQQRSRAGSAQQPAPAVDTHAEAPAALHPSSGKQASAAKAAATSGAGRMQRGGTHPTGNRSGQKSGKTGDRSAEATTVQQPSTAPAEPPKAATSNTARVKNTKQKTKLVATAPAGQQHTGGVGDTEAQYADETTAFVKFLPNDISEDELQSLFPKATAVRLLRKPSGAHKGCAYIDFEAKEDLTEALKQDRKELRGKYLSVAKSAPPKPTAPRNVAQHQTQTQARALIRPRQVPGRSQTERKVHLRLDESDDGNADDDRSVKRPRLQTGAQATSNDDFKRMMGL